MIKVIYSDPDLKDILESIIGRNFFILCNSILSQLLNLLDMPSRTMNQILVEVIPHDEKELGLADKKNYIIALKVQDSAEENELTLIHEAIHILKPKLKEGAVEELTQRLHPKTPKGVSI